MVFFQQHFNFAKTRQNNISYAIAKKHIVIESVALRLCLSMSFLIATGCSVGKSVQLQDVPIKQVIGINTDNPYRLIASDLIGALLQAKDYETMIQPNIRLPFSEMPLAREIENVLVDSGVRIVRVPNKFGQNVLINTIGSTMNDDNKDEYTVTLVLDRIGLKRRYILTNDYVEPTSSLFVRGASLTSIQLNDAIFLTR